MRVNAVNILVAEFEISGPHIVKWISPKIAAFGYLLKSYDNHAIVSVDELNGCCVGDEEEEGAEDEDGEGAELDEVTRASVSVVSNHWVCKITLKY